jgi:hypothetical protein
VRRVHLVVGLAFVVGFLMSGQYMDRAYDHLRGMDDARRMLFRSTHIYLLFAALLNLSLGLYLADEPSGWRRWLRGIGSALVLAAPPLLATGFLVEPWLTGLDRPYSRPAIYGSLAGLLLHGLASVPSRSPPGSGRTSASTTTKATNAAKSTSASHSGSRTPNSGSTK